MGKKSKEAIRIGQNITYYRGLRDLHQDELGLLVFGDKKYQSKISKFEKATQEPKASELAKIAKALRVDINKLL